MNLLPHEYRHREQLRKAAAECVVLLRKDGAFPLSAPCRLALYGNGARNTAKGGTGSGDTHARNSVTVEAGLARAGFTITTKTWLDAYDRERSAHHASYIAEIKSEAEERGVSPLFVGFGRVEPEYEYTLPLEGDGDACVYVLSRTSGEGNDRTAQPGDVCLTHTEIRDILALNRRYERFMLVLNVGAVVDLSPVTEAKNILYLSQLGSVTGDVLADVLLGKSEPSGRLATTWAAVNAYQTLGDFGLQDDTRYREGIFVGYRYFDAACRTPMFPFGYGLSFTEFRMGKCTATLCGTEIHLDVKVTNVGKLPGREVLQVYVSPPAGMVPKPFQTLAAFQKTNALQPCAQEMVHLSFDLRDLSSYCESQAAYLLEQGDYLLRVGNSSRKTRTVAVLRLDRTVAVKRVKNLFGTPDFKDLALSSSVEKAPDGVPVLEISGACIPSSLCAYEVDSNIEPALRELGDESLARLCLGTFAADGVSSIVGNSALHVAGAAGETTDHLSTLLEGRYLVLADGPAGLSLSPQWVRNEDGTVRSVMERLPDGLDELVSPETAAAMKADYDSVPAERLQYSFTTALPIATAIAQSWSIAFAELCGDIVGEEMTRYGVDLWLAPALNIHRSILCGRNFEYFSEDPLLSGRMAAAMTRGVQRHPGRGVTIKHFAANNQETNRYNNNSVVSEQALREIYLRGFAICIRESCPTALMTSYNLLNGEHTSQRKDLITDYLRGELGFRGLVMTDWITTGQRLDTQSINPSVCAHKVLQAGNELIMPGSQPDLNEIMESIRNGSLTRAELLLAASRVYRSIMKKQR